MAWLAIAAMLLVVAMPVVSRVASLSVLAPGLDCVHDAGKQPNSPQGPADPLDRCGYCVLLHDNPFVGAAAVVALAVAAPPDAIRSAPAPSARPFSPLLSARPRGPPASIA